MILDRSETFDYLFTSFIVIFYMLFTMKWSIFLGQLPAMWRRNPRLLSIISKAIVGITVVET